MFLSPPRLFLTGLLLAAWWAGLPAALAGAQLGVLTTYSVEGEAAVKHDNYMRARKIAVVRALRSAVDQALTDLLGPEAHGTRTKETQKILARPKQYVKSYRFLETLDDETEKISRVRLEVVVFTDALNKQLNTAGLVSSVVKEKAVVVLIRERNFTTGRPARFWDYLPMSEVALTQNLVAAGINVIGRDHIFNAIPEDRVAVAARGDISAAVDIGLKAGAEIVIIGNAASSKLSAASSGPLTVQANLSVKAVSVLKSSVIAAKSDFATARAVDPVAGELRAFEVVGKKMASFLVDAVRRYWEPQPVASKTPAQPPGPESETGDEAPKPAQTKAPRPGAMEDL